MGFFTQAEADAATAAGVVFADGVARATGSFNDGNIKQLTGPNLFNPEDRGFLPGFYIASSGVPAQSLMGVPKYHTTALIRCTPGVTYRKATPQGSWASYDATGTFISGSRTGDQATYVPVDGAVFFRTSCRWDNYRGFWVAVDGDTTVFRPWGQRSDARPQTVNRGYLRRTRAKMKRRTDAVPKTEQIILNMCGDSYTDGNNYWIRAYVENMVALYGDAGGGWTGFGYWSTPAPPYTIGGTQPLGVAGNPRPNLYPVQLGGSITSSYRDSVSPNLSHAILATAGDAITVGFPATPVISGIDLFWVGTADGVIRYSFDGGTTWTTLNVQGTVGNIGIVALTGIPAGAGTLRIERVSGTCNLAGVYFKSNASGIRINKLGASGSNVQMWQAVNATQWQAGFAALGGDAMTYMDGVNSQAIPISVDTYGFYLNNLINRARAAIPAIEVLAISTVETLAERQIPILAYDIEVRRLALANSWAHLSLQPSFGDGGRASEYASTTAAPLISEDLIHPTDYGSALIRADIESVIRP